MKTNRLLWLTFFSATLMLLVPGCATPMNSFNHDYNENFPPQPNYAIEKIDDTHFKIRLNQGVTSPEQRPVTVNYMKKAVWIIANDEARRRGWVEWEVNYIDERDQGWMHVLVAVVIRDK